MTLLRKTIDEHEKAMKQQILTIEKEQKKQLEDYKTLLKHKLQNLNIQQATFDILFSSKNYTKLLQTKQEFDDYVNKTNGTLKSLQMPSRTEFYLEGLDQLQIIQEKIKQCGRHVEIPPYHNAQLEKLIAENGTNQTLNLKGAQHIAGALNMNQTLTVLGLGQNQIGQQGIQHIAESLKNNQTLTILGLRQNQIGHEETQYIADALKVNKKLTILFLEQNQIGPQGAQYIAEALKINQTLTVLSSRQNQIGHQGAQHIAEALEINKTLTALYLEQNQIGPQGAQHIAKTLEKNPTLTTLYLGQNEIGQQGVQHIAKALNINQFNNDINIFYTNQ
ncbi:unnamed protein product [Rotaria sordida]|uniref:Uncharacterized protein n=1 Tax=Rotaria sordida TaxID=392033 RepID=A0A815N2T0_9BILA|nr:unnamed protein product [Rotaria sordida]